MKKFLQILMLAVFLIPFALHAQNTLTVADGSANNSYVPVQAVWADSYLRGQTIYPASTIQGAATTHDMTGGSITNLTYYLSTPIAASLPGPWIVKMMEVSATTLSSFVDMTNATTVYTGPLSVTASTMTITLATPYTYNGGNLLIEVSQMTDTNDYTNAFFNGLTATSASWQGYSTSSWADITGSVQNFIPKTTFTFTGGIPISCYPIQNIAIDNTQTTSSSLTLTWVDTLNTGATYKIYEVSNNTALPIDSGITGSSYTISNLNANTSYTFGVQANCSATDVSLILYVDGRTNCAALSLPYTETFETNSTHLSCWTIDGSGSWTIGTGDYSSSTGAYEGSYNAKITHGVTGSTTKLISPVLDGVTNGMTLDFAYVMRSWSGDVDELRVYSRASASSAWQLLASFTNAVSTWTEESVAVPGTVYQIAFEHTDNYGYGLGIDSVVFSAMAGSFCFPVTNLSFDSATTTSIYLSWNDANSVATYTIYDMSDTSVIATDVNTTNYMVSGLNPSSDYTFGVVALCSATDTSTLLTINARTACDVYSLPFSDSFENGIGCWTMSHCTAGTGVMSGAGATGNYGFVFVWTTSPSQYLISPEFVASTSPLQLDFEYTNYNASYSESFKVGYSTTTNDTASFIWGQEITASTPGWTHYSSAIPAGVKYIAIQHTSNNAYYFLVDDITLGPPPTCLPIANLVAGSITSNSITLNWDANGNTGVTYTIYDMSTNTPVAQNVNGTTYTVTGLTPATSYTFGVQTICSATDSATIETVTAATSCNDITTLPYDEGFESGLGCWTTVNGSSDGLPWQAYDCSTLSGINPHTGGYVASSWSWNGSALHANAWLISPKFVLPNTTDTLTFSWWNITNAGWRDKYSVVLSTTTNDTTAFTTVLYPYTMADSLWTMQSIDLTPYAGQSIYIAFHHVDYDANYLLIDDISLFRGSYVPPAPDTLTVHFAIDSPNPNSGCSINPTGTHQYLASDTVFFNATTSVGYHFVGWEFASPTPTDIIDTLDARYISAYIPASSIMSYGEIYLTAIFDYGNADSTTITYAVNDTALGTTIPAPGTYPIYIGNSIDAQASSGINCDLTAWVYDVYVGTTLAISDTIFSTDADFANPMHFGILPPSYVTYNATITITAIFTATGPQPGDTCLPPSNLTATGITKNSVVLSWTENGTATEWNVVYLPADTLGTPDYTGFHYIPVVSNPYTLTGLMPGTRYYVYVEAKCFYPSLPTEWIEFTTLPDGIADYELAVSLYPNPNNGQFTINNEQLIMNSVQVYDVYGKLLKEVEVNGNTAELDVRELSAGMYFARINTEKGVVTKSFVKK